ncbi:hypothetical protein MRX96_034733 [Rhipicephalus microplus]
MGRAKYQRHLPPEHGSHYTRFPGCIRERRCSMERDEAFPDCGSVGAEHRSSRFCFRCRTFGRNRAAVARSANKQREGQASSAVDDDGKKRSGVTRVHREQRQVARPSGS